jgi:phosphoribosyl-AMP cyclohydrolase
MNSKIISNLKFNEKGLIPAIAQDINSKEVLMHAWMNLQSIEKTLETGFATYFSRSRNSLWKKGETSGNLQKIISIKADCDFDTILLEVEQTGPACHTGQPNCFFNILK